ncbi:Mal-A2 [Cordylochernes scorpioides]|uniref:alpha-glucosidase n=1 Tax=Cordylochernes scorpioides TaxID=51811 RepID=A0ABY6L3Y2_9ARAC|nr:Mal-A2 [Cordylochernes scorpioides]
MGVEELDDYNKGSSPEKDEPCGDTADAYQDEESSVTEKLTAPSHTIKFIPSDYEAKNGDAKIDLGKSCKPQIGLGKEELMKYANDPFWVRLRMFLFVVFWVLWIAMLVGAVVIVILTPKCAPKPEPKWWQKSSIYHVYLKSYQDSNSDGEGDIQGLIKRQAYLSDLKVGALLISPIHPSGGVDGGYDVTDYKAVDDKMGTLEEFDQLIKTMNEKDIRVIMDFVPNHSSKSHRWFELSENRTEPYTDYYVWADNKGTDEQPEPPNNWISVVGGSAWKWSSKRKQFYLHQFSEEQPDLNLTNPLVKKELEEVLKFWLDHGVDGFRIDAISHLYEDEELRDEPRSDDTEAQPGVAGRTTTRALRSKIVLDQLRAECQHGCCRILVTEAMGDLNEVLAYYGNVTAPLAQIPLNLDMANLQGSLTAPQVLTMMDNWSNATGRDFWPNWVMGTHDGPRLASRLGSDLSAALRAMVVLARGTPILYYGDELGMTNLELPQGDSWDKLNLSRSSYRSPMQWDNSSQAGFTTGSPWLPVNPNYPAINVEVCIQTPLLCSDTADSNQ